MGRARMVGDVGHVHVRGALRLARHRNELEQQRRGQPPKREKACCTLCWKELSTGIEEILTMVMAMASGVAGKPDFRRFFFDGGEK